jgi:hypothetical protein
MGAAPRRALSCGNSRRETNALIVIYANLSVLGIKLDRTDFVL